MNRTARTWLISLGSVVFAGIIGFTVSLNLPSETSQTQPMESTDEAAANTRNTSGEGDIPEVVIVARRTHPKVGAR